MERERLSNHLRLLTIERFGSISSLAREVAIPYERLKKCFQRNSFSLEDVNVITDALGIPPLNVSDFEVKIGRRQNQKGRTENMARLEVTLSGLVPKQHIGFVIENRALLEKLRRVVTAECERIYIAIHESE